MTLTLVLLTSFCYLITSLVQPFNLNGHSLKPLPFTANVHQSRNQWISLSQKSSADDFTHSKPLMQFLNKSVASIFLSLCFLSTVSVPSSFAAVRSDPLNYQGDYADPFHPYCERHIDVASDGNSFHYSGTAVGPKGDTVLRGCSEEEQRLYGSRKGAFDGSIIEAGAKITAGDGIHEGFRQPAYTNKNAQKYADVDGIRWDDGNKWVKLASPSDVLTFPDTYTEKSKVDLFNEGGKWFFVAYVAFSLAAGVKEFISRFQKWAANK